MAVSFPPFYTCQILGPDGKPVAGGVIRAYYTGSEVPAPLFAPDGTPLGSSVSIDAAGNAVLCLRVGTIYRLRCFDADGAAVWTRDGVVALGTMPINPMTAPGDLIVGGTGGEPSRLGVGTDGDILATANGAPTWEGGPKKYRNVYQNIPSPNIDDGYLGCLFYLSGSAQALTLPATANIPSKSFIDFVFLDNAATLTITPQGTTTLNEQATAVTIGGKSASLYRLVFLGHGGSGDEWALGGSGNGDHKTAVDAADASPDYLAAKLAAGSGISLTNTGSAVEIAADAQTGDHQLLVSATDAAAGYLGAKLTAGSNVTLTPQTDGDGGQTLEISATGGGGGSDWDIVEPLQMRHRSIGAQYGLVMRVFYPLGPSVRSLAIALGPFQNSYYPGGTLNGDIGIYTLSPTTNGSLLENNATRIAHKSFSQTIVSPIVWASFDADVDVSDKTKVYAAALSFDRPVAAFIPYLLLSSFGTTGSTAYVGTHMASGSHIALASSMNFNQGGTGDITYWFGISSRNLG